MAEWQVLPFGLKVRVSLLPNAGEGPGMRAATVLLGESVAPLSDVGALTLNPSPAIGRGKARAFRVEFVSRDPGSSPG